MDTNRLIKFNLAAIILGAIVVGAPTANAQGAWQSQFDSSIQRYIGSGLLKPSQAADLQAREAKLEAKRQQLLARNGGILSPADRERLLDQSADLGNRLQNYLQRNGYRTANTADTWLRNLVAQELPTTRATYPRYVSYLPNAQRPIYTGSNNSCQMPPRRTARTMDRHFDRFFR